MRGGHDWEYVKHSLSSLKRYCARGCGACEWHAPYYGGRVIYFDTDSVYISAPKRYDIESDYPSELTNKKGD